MRVPLQRVALALAVVAASAGLVASQAAPALMGPAIGVLVGVPGASVELARVVLPIVVALLLVALSIRFGIRAVRKDATLASDLAGGGKLLVVTVWAAWSWLVAELLYRQVWLGWATLFGNLSASLLCSSVAVVLCFAIERALPWSRAPRGVQHVGLSLLAAVGLATALLAWSHRHAVPHLALAPVALVGLGLLASGVRQVEGGSRGRTLVELGLASTLLSGPIWSYLT